jgi:hypothetical protein
MKVTGEPAIVTQIVRGSIHEVRTVTFFDEGIPARAYLFSSETMRISHGVRHSHGNRCVASVANRGESDRCDGLAFWIGSPGKFR